MGVTEARTAPRDARRPLGAARPRWGERLIVGLLFLCGVVSVATTVGIVLALVEPTREFFAEAGIWKFFSGRNWAPLFDPPSFGVQPLLIGTFVVTLCAMLVCLPFGLGAAVYLSEYASFRLRRVLKPVLEVLAGVPTVVYGFFALTFVTPLLQDIWFFSDTKPEVFNALSGGLVMGIMILPTVASLSEDALSGIVASFVLGISRAIGETMIALIAVRGNPQFTFNPIRAMETMAAFIAAAGLGDLPVGTTGYKTIFAVGSTLFVVTFLLNAFSIRLVRKYREVYE